MEFNAVEEALRRPAPGYPEGTGSAFKVQSLGDDTPLLTVTRGFVRTIWAVRLQVQLGWTAEMLSLVDPEDLPIVMLTDFRGKPADFGHPNQGDGWTSGGLTRAGGALRPIYISQPWRTYGPNFSEGNTQRVYVHPLADVDLSSWG